MTDLISDPNQEFLLKMIYNTLAKYDLKSQAYSQYFDFMSSSSNFNHQFASDWSSIYLEKKEKYIKKMMGIKTKNKLNEHTINNATINTAVLLNQFLTESDIKGYLTKLEVAAPYLKQEFKLSKNIKILGKLLELTREEMMFMQAVHASREYMDFFENTFFNLFNLKSSGSDIWALMLGFDNKTMRYLLDKSSLTQFNFISPKKAYDMDNDDNTFRKMYSMLSTISEILNVHDLKESNIESILFPGSLKTDLSPSNYHQKEEIEITSDIINASLKNKTVGTNIMFYGLPGTGKTELALSLANTNGWKVKSVGDIDEKNDREKSRSERIFNLKLATKIYAKSKGKIVLLFDEMEDLFKFDINAEFSKSFLNRIIEKTPVPIIWTCNRLEVMEPCVLRRMTMSIKFDVPPTDARKGIWEYENKKQKLGLSSKTISNLSEVYDIVPSMIKNVTSIAKTSKLDHSKIGSIIENQYMLMNYGFRGKFNRGSFNDQAELYDLGFINADQNMTKMSDQLKKCKPNFSLCLYGPPGTGKSAYGKFLAHELGKPVLFKKASDLLGKYVGESEQNIADAFKQAAEDDKVLIFDEADSLLSSRESASHSWQVSQINEMLTQMESHNKPFVCTTNLVKSLDAAALRRFTFKVCFDFLSKDQISAIFNKYFKHTAPKYLLESEVLTPGDFAVVKKKADIMGITDVHELTKMILQEAEMKPQFKRRIGF